MPAQKKRSDQHLGNPNRAGGWDSGVDHVPNATEDICGPEAPEWLDGFAREWYDALRTSGQAIYFADSDWATAVYVGRLMMETIRHPTAGLAAVVVQACGDLLCTESSRRRVQIELDRAAGTADPDESAGDEEADNWYTKLKAVP